LYYVFFFQAEDGIRDATVTGVQTCALPISFAEARLRAAGRFEIISGPWRDVAEADDAQGLRAEDLEAAGSAEPGFGEGGEGAAEIGRASCRERAGGGGMEGA